MKGSGVQRVQDPKTSDLGIFPSTKGGNFRRKKSLFPATAMQFVTNKPFSTNICINKNKTLYKLLYMSIENYIIHRYLFINFLGMAKYEIHVEDILLLGTWSLKRVGHSSFLLG